MCITNSWNIFGGYRAYTTPISTYTNAINFITIATTGSETDFGDLATDYSGGKGGQAAFSNSTRGVVGGGAVYTNSAYTIYNTIDYVTIASTGNAQDFGDLLLAVKYNDTVSSGIRGVIGGGTNPNTNVIQYVNIASTGDAQDFGDLSMRREHLSGTDNSIRGVFIGGVTPTAQNVIDHITIATTGDAQDFGDLSKVVGYSGSTSDSHGGLG